jgi:hypothetical protein
MGAHMCVFMCTTAFLLLPVSFATLDGVLEVLTTKLHAGSKETCPSQIKVQASGLDSPPTGGSGAFRRWPRPIQPKKS